MNPRRIALAAIVLLAIAVAMSVVWSVLSGTSFWFWFPIYGSVCAVGFLIGLVKA